MRVAAAGIVAAVVIATATLTPRGIATSRAQPAPDIARARDLYESAETAMAEGRFGDAAGDYGAAYDITKDPVLFFKIASANERGGRCDVALIYYGRYLREAKPEERFATLTRTRIAACGGDPKQEGSGSAVDPVAGVGSGSAGSGSGSNGVIAPQTDPAVGSAAPGSPAVPRAKHRLAWMLVGGSIASFTVGAVLAYSANAAESDVSDLYVGLGGTPPRFDASTKARFDALIAEGQRAEKLSWIGFGVAGALAVAAAIRFVTDRDDERTLQIMPTVSPRSAGVSATVRF